MKKSRFTADDAKKPSSSKSMNWQAVRHEMTEEELDRFRNMNWEWYYNCFLFKDEPVAVSCKICGSMNVFLPGEMKKKCGSCGIECHRCEVDEDKK